jgi:AMP-polyphosphate phosphotransferase
MATSRSTRNKISKEDYAARVPELREQLIQLQVKLKKVPFPVLLVIAGVESTGKGEAINTLNSWLDPRGVEVFAFHPPTDEESARPYMWRYWRCLPPQGRIGIYAGSWYTEAMREASAKNADPKKFKHALQRIEHFERLLVADGVLIVKCWLNLSKEAQHKKLTKLESNSRTAWKVTPRDWESHRNYNLRNSLGKTLRKATNRTGASWTIIEAENERTRNVAITEALLTAFEDHYKQHRTLPPAGRPNKITPLEPEGITKLKSLPLDKKLSPAEYVKKRDRWLGKLNQLVRLAAKKKRSIAFIFEGWDAAGKGGAIRRLTNAIDARDCRVIPVAKPTKEEKAHHYLWRFWQHLPQAGRVTVFDRSWYGRVLVERIEGFAREEEWKRAYQELNEFEHQMSEDGVIVLKFWLHISQEEQLKRFRLREETEYKRHKMNEEDWRNRDQWSEYETSVGDMLMLTDKSWAPWYLVSAEDKRYARLQVLKLSCRRIADALEAE